MLLLSHFKQLSFKFGHILIKIAQILALVLEFFFDYLSQSNLFFDFNQHFNEYALFHLRGQRVYSKNIHIHHLTLLIFYILLNLFILKIFC